MAAVLVIEDDPQMRRVVARALSMAQHQVLEATNGREGLALFRTHHPTVVITDLVMPEMEGIEIIRELRHEAPMVRIIAMSGGGATGNMQFLDFARELGADAVLAKPFRASDVVALVTEAPE